MCAKVKVCYDLSVDKNREATMRRPKPLNLSNFRDTSSNSSAQSGNPTMYYYPGAEEESPTPSPTYQADRLGFATVEPEVEVHTTPPTFNLYIEIPESESEDDGTPPAPKAADIIAAHHFFYTPAGLPHLIPLDDDLQLVEEDNETILERQDAEYPIGKESETENADEDRESEPASPSSPLVPFFPIDINDTGFLTELTYQEAVNLQMGILDYIEEAGLTFSMPHASATF